MIGTLAGILIGSGMGQYAVTGLPKEVWLAFRETNAWISPRVMPWIFNGSLLTLVIASVLAKKGARLLFIVASVLCAGAIFITVRIEVPMNHLISSWTPDAMPANWITVREHWLRMHLFRTIAGLRSFLAASLGLSRM